MYIHYSYEHYDQSGISRTLEISNEIQKRITNKKSYPIQNTTSLTYDASQLFQLLTKQGSLDQLLSEIINNVKLDIESNSDPLRADLLDFVTRDKLFNELNKIRGKKTGVTIFKKKLDEFLQSIAKELGYANYGKLCRLILANMAMNYGYKVEEKELIQDFIANCDNRKFTVNKQFIGTLTNSLNKLFMLSKALPSIGEKGSLNYQLNTLTELANKTVGWLNYCGGIIKEIALYQTILEVKHQLALELNRTYKKMNNKKLGITIEPDPEMKKFINDNIQRIGTKTINSNGINIKIGKNGSELKIDLSFNDIKKVQKTRTTLQKITPINSSVNFIDSIGVLEGFNEEGLMNVSGSHSYSEDKALSDFFNQITLNVGKNLVLSELTSEKDGTIYLMNGVPKVESDIIEKVVSNDGLVNVKIKMNREDIVKANKWEEGHGDRWDNAYFRSGKTALYQYSNLMQYEFDIANAFF